jgi:hypothetical protein
MRALSRSYSPAQRLVRLLEGRPRARLQLAPVSMSGQVRGARERIRSNCRKALILNNISVSAGHLPTVRVLSRSYIRHSRNSALFCGFDCRQLHRKTAGQSRRKSRSLAVSVPADQIYVGAAQGPCRQNARPIRAIRRLSVTFFGATTFQLAQHKPSRSGTRMSHLSARGCAWVRGPSLDSRCGMPNEDL